MTPKPHDAVDADRDLEMTLETLDEHWPQAVKRIRAELKRLRAPRSDAGLRSASASGVGVDEIAVSKKRLMSIIPAIDDVMGDTDPSIPLDYTEEEIKRDYPLFWICRELCALSRETGATQSDGSEG